MGVVPIEPRVTQDYWSSGGVQNVKLEGLDVISRECERQRNGAVRYLTQQVPI